MKNQIPKSSNIPELRFPEFSGEWEEKNLGEVSSFWNGKAHEQVISFDGKYIVVNSKFISTNGMVKKYSDVQLSPLKTDDIAIVMSDIPKGKALGKCFMVNGDKKYTLNQRIGGIKSEDIISPFLIHLLNRNKYFLKYDNGVSQTNLRRDEVLNCPLTFPLHREQQKIAGFLGVVDKWIKNLQKQKESLETYKKGMMQKMFSQQIRFKDNSEKDFPNWEWKTLGEVINVSMGQSPNSSGYNESRNGLYLIQGNADIKKRITSPRIWTKEVTKTCEIGDIILTVRAPSGFVAISAHKACIGRGVAAITMKNNADKNFIFQFLLWFEPQWQRIEQGSTFTAISGEDIRSIKLKTPSLKEQQKIAGFLSSLDKLIDSKQNQITQTEKWKKGLMQGLFV